MSIRTTIAETSSFLSDTNDWGLAEDGLAPLTTDGGLAKQLICPRCQATQAEGHECVSCGIVFAKYSAPVVKNENMRARRASEKGSGGILDSFKLLLSIATVVAVMGWQGLI